MKVYRIKNAFNGHFFTSENNAAGFYTSLKSVNRALGHFKARFKYCTNVKLVIMEYELSNEKEIN